MSKPRSLEDKYQSEMISKNFSMVKSSFHYQLQPFPFAPCWPGGLCDTNSKQVLCVYSCLSLVESPHHYTNTGRKHGIFGQPGETCSPLVHCISGADGAPWFGQSSPTLHRSPFLLHFVPRQGCVTALPNNSILDREDISVKPGAKSVPINRWHSGI